MRWYNRDGETITVEQWTWLHSQLDYRIVARAETDETLVSTVWLGIDHGFGFTAEPLIFETMIFAEGSDLDQACWRCATEEHALALHRYALAQLGAVVN